MTNVNKIVISSGHSLRVRGAGDIIDEVNEARRVVNRVTTILQGGGVGVIKFHDDTSTSQAQNLRTITTYHNKQTRSLDVSVHFNASSRTTAARGVEVLHFDTKNKADAAKVSAAISKAGGLKDRGAKTRTNLAFLRDTTKPALLLEICFVDSVADTKAYNANFEAICQAVAKELAAIVGATLQPAQAPKLTTSAASKLFYIKTGTFAAKDHAETAVAKMKAAKIVGVASVVPTGDKFYIRTGTFPTTAAAERALQQLKYNKIVWVGSVLAA